MDRRVQRSRRDAMSSTGRRRLRVAPTGPGTLRVALTGRATPRLALVIAALCALQACSDGGDGGGGPSGTGGDALVTPEVRSSEGGLLETTLRVVWFRVWVVG